jgi:hypothetical protein
MLRLLIFAQPKPRLKVNHTRGWPQLTSTMESTMSDYWDAYDTCLDAAFGEADREELRVLQSLHDAHYYCYAYHKMHA